MQEALLLDAVDGFLAVGGGLGVAKVEGKEGDKNENQQRGA